MTEEKKIIKYIFLEFLVDQENRLSEAYFNYYRDAISLYRNYLNRYGDNHLNSNESKLLSSLDGEKEFCEIFDYKKINDSTIDMFLDYFLPRKVAASDNFIKTVPRVFKKFIKWMKSKEYMTNEEYENCIISIDYARENLEL